jgi:hypothetical protein
MADSIRWQIIDSLVAGFLAMTPQKTSSTLGYIYLPDEVASITPPIHQYLSDRSPKTLTVYGLWIEDSDTTERMSQVKNKTMRVFIQACRRYVPLSSASDPFKQREAGQEPEELVRSNLAHDIERFMDKESIAGGGDQLGDLYENWELLGDDTFQLMSVRCPGWVMIEMETLFTYHYRFGEPSLQGAP